MKKRSDPSPTLWAIDEQGNLNFPLRQQQLRDAYSPDSLWVHPAVSFIIMLICATLDYVVFTQLFAAILYDRVIIQRLSTIGCLVAFDVAPIYLGTILKKHHQGLRISYAAAAALALAFVLVLVFNFWLRITMKDVLVPNSTSAAGSLFAAAGSDSSAAALPYAIFSSCLPLATSLVTLIVSFLSADPVKERLKKLHAAQFKLEHAIHQLESVLTEYREEPDLQARLDAEDRDRLAHTTLLATELGYLYADYVRERIKEHLGDPAATNELSKDCRSKLNALLASAEAESDNRLPRSLTEKEAA